MSNLQRWFLIVALWMVILGFTFSFYWSQVRPVGIRKMCAKKATLASKEMKPDMSSHELYRVIYSDCCRNNGIRE